MARFGRKDKGGMPSIPTSALPDIIYMLLFFFMVTTTMKEVNVMVKQNQAGATEVKKLEKKSLVSYIYIGSPHAGHQKLYGTEPRIQLNDQFALPSDIGEYISSERDKRKEQERPFMRTSMKIDKDTKMGIVSDVKQELRKAQALNITYSTIKVESVY